MKLLLLILALTVYQITPAAIGGYNLVDPSELNQDKNIQDILSFGARYVIEQGIQAQDLPDFDYEVTAVYSVYRQVVSGLNYMFDIEIRGAEGTIIRSSYIVYDQEWTNTRKVTSYNYDIEETGETGNENLEFLPDEVYWSEEENNEGFIAGGWTQHDLSEVENDPEIQALLNYGVQDLTQQEVLAQQLPNAQYTVSQVHSVWSQVVSGLNYRFDVDITNDLGWVLRATFVVYSQPWTGTQDVTSYAYAVTTNPNPPAEEEEFVIPEEDLPGGYQPIDPSEVDTDEQLKNALGAGVRDVVGQAVINHHLPESRYDVDQIHSIYGQVVSGMNYRFDVDLINCAGLVARAVFTVYSQSWTHTLDTTLDRLEITSIPDEGLIGGDCPQGDNGEDGNEEATPGETEWETEWGETGPIVGGYTPVDLQEAEKDPIIQELLNFGAQFVATEGINGHRLPDSEYQVNQVYSVQEQVVAGMNYQFDVELANCHGLTVRANYVVYYVSWQGTKQVSAYSFDITGAPNGFFIGGCPNEGEEESTVEEEEGEGTIVGDFSPVDLQDAEKDQQLQDALTFGVQELAKRAIADGELPDNSYSLDSLNSVEQQVVSGMNYRFDANLLSGDGTSVRATFEVYSQPWTNTQKLISYSILAVGPANEGSP